MISKDPTSRDNPGDYSNMPVRPAGGGYGATAEEIARGYRSLVIPDTDSRNGPFPAAPRGQPETLTRDKDGI
jgi:hypothetical protein